MSEVKAVYEVNHTEIINIGLVSDTTSDIEEVLNDESASSWIRWALRSALHRDPINAANDAGILESLLENRANEILITPCSGDPGRANTELKQR